jgi:hypothetical protein
MSSRRLPGRIAAASLVLFALTSAPAWAGPRPELDVTAGMRPAPRDTRARGPHACFRGAARDRDAAEPRRALRRADDAVGDAGGW